MLSELLYRLSCQPTKIIIHQSWGLPPPQKKTNPNIFGAALPTELPTRQGAKGYHPKTVALPRQVFRDGLKAEKAAGRILTSRPFSFCDLSF